jgi:hydroxymethylpyrimidine pyrophosphatase-like HAD family hydrolase
MRRSEMLSRQTRPLMETLFVALQHSISSLRLSSMKIRFIEDFGIGFYLCAKSSKNDEMELDTLEKTARDCREANAFPVRIFRNGNNISLLPEWLDKRSAVEYLIKRFSDGDRCEILSIGMGDSHSDISFMNSCDYAIVPRRSQIAESFFQS